MDNPQLGHFFGVRKYLGGESNSPVVERLNKGLTAAWSPSRGKAAHPCRRRSAARGAGPCLPPPAPRSA
eukprot:2865720-Pyramimonas_sp.AAC.1